MQVGKLGREGPTNDGMKCVRLHRRERRGRRSWNLTSTLSCSSAPSWPAPNQGSIGQHNTAPADHNGLNGEMGNFGTGGERVGGFRLSPVDDLGKRAGRTLVRVVPRSPSSRRTEERGFHFWRRCGLQVKQGDPQFKLCLVALLLWLVVGGQGLKGLLPHVTSHCLVPLMNSQFPVY